MICFLQSTGKEYKEYENSLQANGSGLEQLERARMEVPEKWIHTEGRKHETLNVKKWSP